MNTKLIHYDQCYYNEHKTDPSQWHTESTTHLLHLLTKYNRTTLLPRVTHEATGAASRSVAQKCCLRRASTKIPLQGALHQSQLTKQKTGKPNLLMASLTSAVAAQL